MRLPVTLKVGAAISVAILLAALVSLIWTPYDVTSVSVGDRLKAPFGEYLLGTDHLGRDMVSMLMVGARTSIAVAILAEMTQVLRRGA